MLKEKKMKVGIIGAGTIARKMAATLKEMPNVTGYAIAARDYERAAAFAKDYDFEKAYGSYEEMLDDKEVELVYIATPHSHHFEHASLCIEKGKHVLCEKPMTVNREQARILFEKAVEKKVLITEAMWTRYMPSRKLIDEVMESGIIGTPTTLIANIGYPISHKERIMEPSLAGGALLDIGIYPIHFASMVFGDHIKSITGTAMLSDKGVDLQHNISLIYEDGKMAMLQSTVMAATDLSGVIYGDKGYMVVENINNCEGIRVYDNERRLVKRIEVPEQITGFEYEVADTVEAIKAGKLECEAMPHGETLSMMKIMDELRREWGISYPCE